MATFILSSDITIGKFRFSGVHQVRIRKSLLSYVNTATIKLPSRSAVIKQVDGKLKGIGQPTDTSKLFNEGDPVIINLGYNGQLKEEFRGFIVRRNLNYPMEIQCEGYSYQLRKQTVSKSWKSSNVKEVLSEAVKGTDVKLLVADNIDLVNIVCAKKTGTDLIDFVKKASNGALNAWFIDATTLWVGLVYVPGGAGMKDTLSGQQVNYVLGRNVVKDNKLVERIPNTELTINAKMTKTKRHRGAAAPREVGKVKKWVAQAIGNQADLDKMVQSLEAKANYRGLEGRISAFLQPYAEPGWKAKITDPQFQERQGVYLIESIEIDYSLSGARRVIELGPQIQL